MSFPLTTYNHLHELTAFKKSSLQAFLFQEWFIPSELLTFSVLFFKETSLEEPLCSLLTSSPLRSHNSTGDLKHLESSARCQEDPESLPQGFRRRASTISHSPMLSYSEPSLPPLQPTGATKPKLVRHYSVSTDSPHQSKWDSWFGGFLILCCWYLTILPVEL